jgi:hypothetical protein
MPADQIAQARIDGAIKKQAAAVLQASGLSISDAIRIMLTRTAEEGALPFQLRADVRTPPPVPVPEPPRADGLDVGNPQGLNVNFGALVNLIEAQRALGTRVSTFDTAYWADCDEEGFQRLADIHVLSSEVLSQVLATTMAFDPGFFVSVRTLGEFITAGAGRRTQRGWNPTPHMSGFDVGSRMWAASLGTSAINPTVGLYTLVNMPDRPNSHWITFGVGALDHLDPFCVAVGDHAIWVDAIAAAGGLTPCLSNVIVGLSNQDARTPSKITAAFHRQFVRPALNHELHDSVESFDLEFEATNPVDIFPAALAATALTMFAAGAIANRPESIYRALGYGNAVLRVIEEYRKVTREPRPASKRR